MNKVKFGNTDMVVSKIALGGYPFAGVNKAQGWDPYSADGEKEAIRTINTALDCGINYIDTAPGYGKGHSESLIGQVMEQRRSECYLATKCPWAGTKEDVIQSVENSLRRLRTDYVDVVQFHGGRYTEKDVKHILEEGPLEGMFELKRRGLVRYLGITSEEPWTVVPFIKDHVFDVYQICYNLIRQAAAQHVLNIAKENHDAVCAMRPMTSGILQRELEYLAPEWLEDGKAFLLCLKFLLSDSRVHMLNVGMRWSREVQENMRFLEEFEPSFDVADVPWLTAKIYESDDKRSEILI